jgi:hypothetical protein
MHPLKHVLSQFSDTKVMCDCSDEIIISSEAKTCVTTPPKCPFGAKIDHFWANFGFFQCEGLSKIFGTCDKCDILFFQKAVGCFSPHDALFSKRKLYYIILSEVRGAFPKANQFITG